MSNPTRRKTLPRHWYRVTYDWCPLCSHSTVYRERVYGKKPKRGAVSYTETWCGCCTF